MILRIVFCELLLSEIIFKAAYHFLPSSQSSFELQKTLVSWLRSVIALTSIPGILFMASQIKIFLAFSVDMLTFRFFAEPSLSKPLIVPPRPGQKVLQAFLLDI